MPVKLSFEYVFNFIREQGDEMISKTYNNSNEKFTIKCCNCDNLYLQNFSRYSRGYRHKNCPIAKYKKPLKLLPKICDFCKESFQPNFGIQKMCSLNCVKKNEQMQEYKDNAKLNGRKGGLISAQKQNRRSKNEIYFSELCEQHFGKDLVTTNEKFFDGWDADVIIHSIKVAVLWNGSWHYKKITRKHSLEQVQTRDYLKNKIIEKYGYSPYTIMDLGKFNRKFVEQEFEIFRLSLINYF